MDSRIKLRLERRVIAEPPLHPGDAEYFAAAARGELVLKTCEECGQPHHYPRAICPFCFSGRLHWTRSAGRGTVYSFSVTHAKQGPYCVAYVHLDEGVTMLSGIVDCDTDAVRIDMRVEVVFAESEGGVSVPMFRPATDRMENTNEAS